MTIQLHTKTWMEGNFTEQTELRGDETAHTRASERHLSYAHVHSLLMYDQVPLYT